MDNQLTQTLQCYCQIVLSVAEERNTVRLKYEAVAL